jgi:hypothetical protein
VHDGLTTSRGRCAGIASAQPFIQHSTPKAQPVPFLFQGSSIVEQGGKPGVQGQVAPPVQGCT